MGGSPVWHRPTPQREEPSIERTFGETRRRVKVIGRIPAFVELGRKIKRNIKGIEAAMLNNLSNALVESTNTKLRVLHRMAFGFAKPEHLIALALLDRGGYCPPLPGRAAA
jgi:transposase